MSRMKKYLAALLAALVLVFALSVSVSADPSGARVPPPSGSAFPSPMSIEIMLTPLDS